MGSKAPSPKSVIWSFSNPQSDSRWLAEQLSPVEITWNPSEFWNAFGEHFGTQCDHLGNPILRAWAATWHLPTHFTWHKNPAFTVSPTLVLYQLILRVYNLWFVVEITHSAQIHWLKPCELISRHHGQMSRYMGDWQVGRRSSSAESEANKEEVERYC